MTVDVGENKKKETNTGQSSIDRGHGTDTVESPVQSTLVNSTKMSTTIFNGPNDCFIADVHDFSV